MSARALADARLRVRVRAAPAASRGTYGAIRVPETLAEHGERAGRHHIAWLMQQEGIAGRTRRRARSGVGGRCDLRADRRGLGVPGRATVGTTRWRSVPARR